MRTGRRERCWLGWLGLVCVSLCVVVGAVSDVGAAGFALYEGSARGNALGGALVGRADDPSALFYNPAGITQLPGLQVMGGATAVIPSTDARTTDARGNTVTSSTEDNVWLPPHFYATYQYTDRVWFGLGVFSPFGLGTEFESTWPGRFNSYQAVIETLTVNPNIAFKLTDRLSMAAGFEVMWFDLDLRQKVATTLGDVDQKLTGDSFGYGFNAALHYKACDWLSLGASYRSQVRQNVEGDADFTKPAGLPSALFNDTDASGAIMLPDMVFLGAAFYPMKQWSVELGLVWTRWSSFDDLTINYVDPILPGVSSVTRVKDWDDVWRLNVGVEYKALDWLDLRVGYTWDEEPVSDAHADYLVPANDRHLFSFGPGFHWDKWTVDLSYTYLYITDRDVVARPSEGVLTSTFEDGHAHLVGLSVGYKF